MERIFSAVLAAALLSGCAAPAIYKSSARGDLGQVKALLASGADPNEHSALYANETPLHAAVWNSRLDVARYLLEHGADPNAEASAGSMGHKKYFGTPLVYAACVGQASMVKLLLEHGANPDPAPGLCSGGTGFDDIDMGTPLQLAEKRRNSAVAAMLRRAIESGIGLTEGGLANTGEYGPIAGGLLKDYKGTGRTIAVAGFSYADGRASSDGDIVAARLTTELVKMNSLKVVERSAIEKVLAELKLQNAGAMDQASAKKVGSMLGADLIAVGTLTELPDKKLELNARLVDVESGVAVSAVLGKVTRNWGSGL